MPLARPYPPAIDNGRVSSYTYDSTERLTCAAYSTGECYQYDYDDVGNRTTLTITEAFSDTDVTTYTYDTANRLTAVDSVSYTYDHRGNLIYDGVYTYTYNGAGRMVQAQGVTMTLVYTYNADGLRVAQEQNGVPTHFVWDWATPVPEMLSDGTQVYLVGHDTLGWVAAGGWTFVLPDALGSVRQELALSAVEGTDATGSVTAAREWSPFGVELGAAQGGLGFTGEWLDAGVGLTYLRARWYDGETGRFTQVDPLAGYSLAPSTTHDYAYVAQNPVLYTDPTGWERENPDDQAMCNNWPPDYLHINGFNPYRRSQCYQATAGLFPLLSRAEIYGGLGIFGWIKYPEAARNIRHFFLAGGQPMEIDSGWLRSYSVVQTTETSVRDNFIRQVVVPQIRSMSANGTRPIQNAAPDIGENEWLVQAEMGTKQFGQVKGILYGGTYPSPSDDSRLFYALGASHIQAKFKAELSGCGGVFQLTYHARYRLMDMFNFEIDKKVDFSVGPWKVTIPDAWGISLYDAGWGKYYDQYADWFVEQKLQVLPDGTVIP